MKSAEEIREVHLYRHGMTTSSKDTQIGRKIHDSAIGAMEEYADQFKPKWISVEDDLPELATFVICHKKNGLVLGLYYSADREFRYAEQIQRNQVTHWMPLPEPPNT